MSTSPPDPPEAGPPEPREDALARRGRHLERATALARWLDDRYLDPIVGLVLPGMGDIITSGAGLYIVALAAHERLPPVVVARMLLNLALDAALGAIPVIGDAFDVLHKANKRNLALLEARHTTRRARVTDWFIVGAAGAAFLGALALPLIVLALILGALF